MRINLAYLDFILEPLLGGADDDCLTEKYAAINPNDCEQISTVLKETVKAEFESRPNRDKDAAKLALSYVLKTNSIDFEGRFNSNLLPFEHPEQARDFYVWLWDVLFEKEDFNDAKFDGPVKVADKPNELLGLSDEALQQRTDKTGNSIVENHNNSAREHARDWSHFIKSFFIPGLRKSNFGRQDGWYIELDGVVVGELLDYQWHDMFWDSYVVVPKDDSNRETMMQKEFWFKREIRFRNRRTGAYVMGAFSNGPPQSHMRISMRGLYLTW